MTAGVKPGGLRSKQDIKLLICYLLSSIPQGLSKTDLINVLQDNNLANYFEVASAFDELLKQGNLTEAQEEETFYTVTASGKMIAQELDVSLPISIREQVLSAALSLMAQQKRERENTVTITKIENGCQVECHISGGEMDLMSFTLYVPDMMQAKTGKAKFSKGSPTDLQLYAGRLNPQSGYGPRAFRRAFLTQNYFEGIDRPCFPCYNHLEF